MVTMLWRGWTGKDGIFGASQVCVGLSQIEEGVDSCTDLRPYSLFACSWYLGFYLSTVAATLGSEIVVTGETIVDEIHLGRVLTQIVLGSSLVRSCIWIGRFIFPCCERSCVWFLWVIRVFVFWRVLLADRISILGKHVFQRCDLFSHGWFNFFVQQVLEKHDDVFLVSARGYIQMLEVSYSYKGVAEIWSPWAITCVKLYPDHQFSQASEGFFKHGRYWLSVCPDW